MPPLQIRIKTTSETGGKTIIKLELVEMHPG